MKPDLEQPAGFTLTENLMAMTLIVSVAVPLSAMLGVAMSTRTTGDLRKTSALIARQISAELVHSPAELGAPSAHGYPLIAVRRSNDQVGGGDWPYRTTFPADLHGHNVYVLYDTSLRPAGEISASAYQKGVETWPDPIDSGVEPLLAVQIAFERAAASSAASRTYRATVSVGSPVSAPLASRRVETFTTLVHVAQPSTGT